MNCAVITDNNLEKNDFMQTWLKQPSFSQLSFTKISNHDDLQALARFRLKIYREQLPYMLTPNGHDEYDDKSLIFAIWYQDQIAASIRLTPQPFESEKYIAYTDLQAFLGENFKKYYLEWSRLVVDTNLKIPGLVGAITTFAGLYVLNNTHYTHYFGYTKKPIRRILSGFRLAKESLPFQIPERGEHRYYLLKGNFMNDFEQLKNRFEIA